MVLFVAEKKRNMCRLDEDLVQRGIVVDAFDEKRNHPKLNFFFLTHAHADHTQQLRKKWVQGSVVWSHAITWQLAQLEHTYLRTIPHQPMVYHEWYPLAGLKVCALPAHHCDGSAMFLFQLPTRVTILYTGDFRFVRDPVLMALKPDRLYLDDSFWDLQLPLPSLQESYLEFSQWLLKTPRPVYIHTGALGAEPMYREYSRTHGELWCIDPALRGTYREKQLRIVLPDCLSSGETGLILSHLKKHTPQAGETWLVPSCQPALLCRPELQGMHPLLFCTHAGREELDRFLVMLAPRKVIRCGHESNFECKEKKP
jgi:hypothetical protein